MVKFNCRYCSEINLATGDVNKVRCHNCQKVNFLNERKWRKYLLFIAIAAMIILFVSYLRSDTPSSELASSAQKKSTADSRKAGALVISENFVKNTLKAPSTADFGGTFEQTDAISTVIQDENHYVVNYHVDAQNSFGAKLRSNYVCRLTFLGGDDNSMSNWHCDYLNIDGQTIIKEYHPTAASEKTNVLNNPATPKYEIIRKPNGGTGVFDFMYIVVVPKKYSRAEMDLIFEDIVNTNGGGKISIDVWDSKEIFIKTLAIYNEEDRRVDAGLPIKEYMQSKRVILEKFDKHNIAKYDNNGVDINKSYPDEVY